MDSFLVPLFHDDMPVKIAKMIDRSPSGVNGYDIMIILTGCERAMPLKIRVERDEVVGVRLPFQLIYYTDIDDNGDMVVVNPEAKIWLYSFDHLINLFYRKYIVEKFKDFPAQCIRCYVAPDFDKDEENAFFYDNFRRILVFHKSTGTLTVESDYMEESARLAAEHFKKHFFH